MADRGYTLPSRGLVSTEQRAMQDRADVPRSRFEGSFSRKASYHSGALYPILVDEILPGDHMRYDLTAFVRMATPLFPLLDNQRIDTHFFFVPNRLVWDDWQKLMGETGNTMADDHTDYVVPQIVIRPHVGDDFPMGLADHFGLPVAQAVGSYPVNALPFRAYALIWNEWFRDQNLQDKIIFSRASHSTDDTITPHKLMWRNKPLDYFTSALPWPQKFVAPMAKVTGQANVLGLGYNTTQGITSGAPAARQADGTMANAAGPNQWQYYVTGGSMQFRLSDAGSGVARPMIYADLASAAGIDVNSLRQAFLVQALQERDARGGTRYTEIIKAHFGVTNPDFRLQRPEYIGGGQTPLQITPIAQTTPVTGAGVVGSLGAAGTGAGSHSATYAATEHGFIIGLLSIRTDVSYQQGLHRMWSRATRYDYYWPALAGLGEQAILRQEIYLEGGASTTDATVFGYQERYHEYRTRYSDVVGIMRSTATGTLDTWHLAQRFNTPPLLNSDFLKEEPPMSRVLAAGETANGQQYIADLYFRRTATRPIPMYGTPVQLARF